jgi:hypothetical protein
VSHNGYYYTRFKGFVKHYFRFFEIFLSLGKDFAHSVFSSGFLWYNSLRQAHSVRQNRKS